MAPRRLRLAGASTGSQAVSKSLVRQMISSAVRRDEELKSSVIGSNGNTSVAGAIAGITNNITNSTTGLSDRVGLKIIARTLEWKFQATINTLATSDRVRLIIFADTTNQNALPSVSDVLSTASVQSFINQPNLINGRIKILLDRTFQLNTAGNAGCFATGKIKLGAWPVYYAGGTNYGRNNIFFLEISDTPTNLATFAFNSEVRFTDA